MMFKNWKIDLKKKVFVIIVNTYVMYFSMVTDRSKHIPISGGENFTIRRGLRRYVLKRDTCKFGEWWGVTVESFYYHVY